MGLKLYRDAYITLRYIIRELSKGKSLIFYFNILPSYNAWFWICFGSLVIHIPSSLYIIVAVLPQFSIIQQFNHNTRSAYCSFTETLKHSLIVHASDMVERAIGCDVKGLAQRPMGRWFDSRDHRLSDYTSSGQTSITLCWYPCSPSSVNWYTTISSGLGVRHCEHWCHAVSLRRAFRGQKAVYVLCNSEKTFIKIV